MIVYRPTDGTLERWLGAFPASLRDREAHYGLVGTLVGNNPLLALDCLRRACLLFGDPQWQHEAADLVASTDLSERATDSVEMILASFAR